MQRHGMTIPFGGSPLGAQRELIEELVALGYTDLWSVEANTSDAFTPLVAMDDKGFILTGLEAREAARGWGLVREPMMFETNVPGVFAAGDVRSNANRRIAAAVGEGSAAIFSIHQYLRSV